MNAIEGAGMTSVALADTLAEVQPPVATGRGRLAIVAVGDVLGAAAMILCIPLGILAIGIPIALVVRLLLWSVGQL
jgi:hypothetical protein